MEAAGIRFTAEGVIGGAGGSNELISRSQSAIRRYHNFYAMGVQTNSFSAQIFRRAESVLDSTNIKDLSSYPAFGTDICISAYFVVGRGLLTC